MNGNNLFTTLHKARQAKGITQSELSELLGLPQSYISQVEKGKHDVRTNTLLNWARILDLELVLIPRQQIPAVSYLSSLDKADKKSLPAAYGPLADEVS